MKICVRCKTSKIESDFHKQISKKDGLKPHCKCCVKESYKKPIMSEASKASKAMYMDVYNVKYKEINKESIRIKNAIYIKNKRSKDDVFRLKHNIRSSIIKSFKGSKNLSSSSVIGCDIDFFIKFIENKFEGWMTFCNYGKYNGDYDFGWDLDHITPISLAKSKAHVVLLNHYTNFQPLCSKLNRDIKKNKSL